MAQKNTLSPNQDMAANPSENVWVQANAGTGKTSVLVQRLLRILFRTDDDINCGILCLTYTNAAAGEMRNRILSALRKWAMLTDDALRDELAGVALTCPVGPDDINRARKIFFKYIDNPDVLKIKTIHGFCEEILRRFPIEAGISPAWTLASEEIQHTLLQDAFSRLINSTNDERVSNAFTHIVGRVSEYYLDDMLKILSTQYKDFFRIENDDKYRKYFIDTTRYFLDLDTPIQTHTSAEKLQNIIDCATYDINNAKTPAKYLIKIINLTKQYIDKTIDFEEYKTAYLKTDGGKNPNVLKKDYLADEQNRVYTLNQRNAAQMVFDDTVAMFDLASAFAKIYKEIKSQRNMLDFEDLILYTRRLFSNPETMGWVLSQLNVRLGHILVDEAQDTGPLQWDVLRMLAGDFFTDGDTSQTPHSLFVVGDTKQSIYGFQGADPRAFASSREIIATQIQQNMRTIREIPLEQSFRSLAPILRTVDVFFSNESIAQMTGFSNNLHRNFRQDTGGLVEIHRLISKQDDNISSDEYLKSIADKIKVLLDNGEFKPHDIMVLVQKRAPMAPVLVKELKRRGIPVAGSDRIVLPRFPAIRDMLNLVRFCINNSDDYSLCCVLKSPIFRLTEQDIFNLCKIKNETNYANKTISSDIIPTTVFDVLSNYAPPVFTRLNQINQWCKTMSPYTFFSHVLNTNDTRQSMIAALGDQIIDPLEEFMTICLAYERTQSGTMRHFLKWFITGGSEIKRDMDASAGVRIVTIHGSKGLESRVVFLVDTVRIPSSDKILPITSDMLPHNMFQPDLPTPWLWTPRGDDCQRRTDALNAMNNAKIAEYYRLLYVAMTRARDRLYIYGYTSTKNAPEIAWHTQLWRVLSDFTTAPDDIETIRITDD